MRGRDEGLNDMRNLAKERDLNFEGIFIHSERERENVKEMKRKTERTKE